MAKVDNEDLRQQYDLIFDVLSKKLEEQIGLISNLDTKASIFLAVTGVVIAGVFVLVASDKLGYRDYKYFVCIELLLLTISGYFVFKAFILEKKEFWYTTPSPKKLLDAFSRNAYENVNFLKEDIIKSIREVYNDNAILATKKHKNFIIAQKFLYAGVILMLLHLVLLFFGINRIIIPVR